jgi:hypothetical protein
LTANGPTHRGDKCPNSTDDQNGTLMMRLAKTLAVVCVLATSLSARVLYVDATDPSAGDDNPGTETQPWKTPYKAASTATAGDTVHFNAGTYPVNSPIEIMHSGTAEEPILFRATPGQEQAAVFDGPAGGTGKGA